jgi:D-arabinitol dehydrogenase (NADP+)
MAPISSEANGNGNIFEIPKEMKAIRYNKIKDFSLVTMPVPEPKPHEILVKIKSCGVCGTDLHIHNGRCLSPESPGYSFD